MVRQSAGQSGNALEHDPARSQRDAAVRSVLFVEAGTVGVPRQTIRRSRVSRQRFRATFSPVFPLRASPSKLSPAAMKLSHIMPWPSALALLAGMVSGALAQYILGPEYNSARKVWALSMVPIVLLLLFVSALRMRSIRPSTEEKILFLSVLLLLAVALTCGTALALAIHVGTPTPSLARQVIGVICITGLAVSVYIANGLRVCTRP